VPQLATYRKASKTFSISASGSPRKSPDRASHPRRRIREIALARREPAAIEQTLPSCPHSPPRFRCTLVVVETRTGPDRLGSGKCAGGGPRCNSSSSEALPRTAVSRLLKSCATRRPARPRYFHGVSPWILLLPPLVRPGSLFITLPWAAHWLRGCAQVVVTTEHSLPTTPVEPLRTSATLRTRDFGAKGLRRKATPGPRSQSG
jgi:hypothetical protein